MSDGKQLVKDLLVAQARRDMAERKECAMTDHLDLEAIKERRDRCKELGWQMMLTAEQSDALISEVERLRAFELTPGEADTLGRAYWEGDPDALNDVEPTLQRIVGAALSESPTEEGEG